MLSYVACKFLTRLLIRTSICTQIRYEDWEEKNTNHLTVVYNPRRSTFKHCAAMTRWKDLPSEIVELVIAKLPVVDIFRVQAVNTRMHELVQKMLHDNQSLLYHRSRVEHESFLSGQLMIPYGAIVGGSGTSVTDKPPHVFEPRTKSRNVRLPELSSFLPGTRGGKIVTMYAGNGGLVLLGLSARRTMIVCNPLTKSWRDLPLLPTRLQLAKLFKVVMVDKSKRSYKIALFTNPSLYTKLKTCYSLVYTPGRQEWIRKEHNYIDLLNERLHHVCVDDVNSNLAHALVSNWRWPPKVEIVTFDAEAMIWTPWGYDKSLVINHPTEITRVYTLLVQDGVVYVVVDQAVCTYSQTHLNDPTLGSWTTILRLDRHAGKPTAHKLTETYFDKKYYEGSDRWKAADHQTWFIWKSTSRRVISKICEGEVFEYDLLGGTWSSHKRQVAGLFGPKSYFTQARYEECWMSV